MVARETRDRRASAVAAVLTVALVVVAGSAAAISGRTSSDTEVRSNEPSADEILALVANDHLTSLADGKRTNTVEVSGSGTADDGEATRTLWYEGVAGAAYAQELGYEDVRRTVTGPNGESLESTTDRLSATRDAFAATDLSEEDLRKQVTLEAAKVGARVVDVHYISLFGGTAEISLAPSDEVLRFVKDAGTKLAGILASVDADGRPYLVRVVDEQGAPQLLLGFVPGLGGTHGQGLAWITPGAQSSAIWGSDPVVIPDQGTLEH